MSRLMLAMVGCLVVGAGGMWVASNFKVKFEAVGTPDQPPLPPPVAQTPAPPVPPPAEPAKLPSYLLAQPTPQPQPGVVQASGSVPAVAVGAAALGVGADPLRPDVVEVTENVDGVGAITWGKPDATKPLRLATGTPTLKFAALTTDSGTATITSGGDDVTPINIGYNKNGTLNLDLSKFPNKAQFGSGKAIELTITRTIPDTNTAVSKFTLIRPRDFAVAEPSFTVDRASVTKLLPAENISALTGDTAKIVNEFLRVQGTAPDSYLGSAFFAVLDGKPPKEVAQANREANAGKLWSYALQTQPEDNGKTAKVLVRADFSSGEHAYKFPSTPFAFSKNFDPIPAPKVVVAPASSAAGKFVGPLSGPSARNGLPSVPSNTSLLSVTVTPDPIAKAVALFVDGQFLKAKPSGTTVLFEDLEIGEGKEHAIRVEALLGNTSSPPAQLQVNVVKTPPNVDSVTATAFGQSNGAVGGEKVYVRFNSANPLEHSTAENPDNYKVVRKEDTAATNLSKVTPSFDPLTNTVALVVGPVVPGSYSVLIKPAVKDIYGNALAKGGSPTDVLFIYESTLFTGGAPGEAALPSSTAGVAPTGQNAVFPEYTKFREFEDGANPGDRVESRVVRLYYTRDGHRVVQIVNRDVRSFNGPSVDIRRRAADKVRDEADALQNDRQRQERAAVQSAVATRQAETQLKQLEAKLQTARTEQATATVQLSQRTQQLDQFTRTLGRDQTNIDLGTRSDLGVDTATRRLAAVNADIERTNTAITDNAPKPEGPTDEQLNTARSGLVTSQATLATADAAAKNALAKPAQDQLDAAVKLAKAEKDVADNENQLNRDALIKARGDKTSADLALQTVQLTEGAKVRNALADVDAKQQVVRDLEQRSEIARQKAAQREAALRQANATLVTQKVARDQAQRNLDQAVAAARGRAITDTRADPSLDTTSGLREEIRKLQLAQSSAATTEQATRAEAEALRGKIQGLRAEELRLTEATLGKEGEERRKREEQFRREVAAALADPDTYAAGKPDSVDPVLQCSVSVIGEGLIHIRGPVKGLNVIRTMINQIDAPTGQVRVGVHTVQVNGERVERMNKVVENIQRYIDHSRFLTATSAQMLRNAVTTVASRKAVEAGQTLAPGCTQADRDEKYLYCFFGKDFIDELKSLDSEFLRTGNKVLSLHSMDSTSLASALFLMSLARNDVREDILREFQGQLCTKLPQAEWQKFVSGLSCPSRLEACFDRQFCTLAQNAKFPSFLGFFNSEVLGADTLTPVQREFIRLAQIFKARMVTELELKQRVMERTLLEDRVGNFRKEQRDAKDREDDARKDRLNLQVELQGAIAKAAVAFNDLLVELDEVEKGLGVIEQVLAVTQSAPGTRTQAQVTAIMHLKQSKTLSQSVPGMIDFSVAKNRWVASALGSAADNLARFRFPSDEEEKAKAVVDQLLKLQQDAKAGTSIPVPKDLARNLKVFTEAIARHAAEARQEIGEILRELRKERPDVERTLNRYSTFRDEILKKLSQGEFRTKLVDDLFGQRVGPAFTAMQASFVKAQASARVAQLTRRPLDEKKLLDMLVDDMEEKLIELLDGTRAHTANVDNYLKALATALDDDFTTQFYQPAFKKIRTLAAGWDVQLGQIETTTVLTNNRVLGKVSPTASMEFDLPRRDILIKEAFKGAKAAVQDYGALLNDPVFLSMVKMYSGSPVGATYGGFGGLPAVKNALPGLPGSADELIMAQSGAKRPEFGTYLEGLIADPAIYKFETGTGYEIRPVLSPDGQAVVFGFDYMYTTDVREPVRADEKHLGRVRRHLLHTDVQLSNFELREVSKYWVSIKAARTSKGVSLLQDIPVAGALFRPAPSASSSLQQNLIYAQAAIFPTLFDLMGLRYAPAVADLSPDGLIDDEFVTRGRQEYLRQYIFDYGASRVDDALRILYGERRPDLYRSQRSIPARHPNGYEGGGLRQRDAHLEEEYDPRAAYPPTKFSPGLRLPQRFDRDPFDPSEPPAGGPAIPPGAIIPGHAPFGPMSSRELPRTPIGTTVTRVPPPPRGPAALPPIPMNGYLPKIPQSVPVIAPPPATPTQPSGVISRSQAPLDPPAIPRMYASDPVPLPRGSFFPR